jgi:hypothetical protein
MLEHPIFQSFVRDSAQTPPSGPHIYGDWPSQAVAEDTLLPAGAMRED